jgi:2-haloacid dehalogenase
MIMRGVLPVDGNRYLDRIDRHGKKETSPMALDGVKALVFDVFGTVVDWRSGVARDAAPFLARHGAHNADPGAFADAWRARYMPAMEEVRRGRRPFVRLDVLHRENLLAILPEFGIDPAKIPVVELDDLNHAWHRLDPWPDAVAGLTRLRNSFIVAPLSNGNISLMIDMAKRAGLPWDAILGAEVAQAYKPMPEAYLRTAEILALAPSQLCMVAAHNGDLAAARACGLRTCFVPRPLEFGPGGKPDINPAQDWDLVVLDFAELAAGLR